LSCCTITAAEKEERENVAEEEGREKVL